MSKNRLALSFLFAGMEAPPFLKAADFTDDGAVDISDAVALLSYQFLGGKLPSEPFPVCGTDRTSDDLTCYVFARCP